MENASKALMIAGGVLIAIIIIAMFIMMFNNIANMQKEQEEQLKIEQIVAFNSEFEAYNKTIMYGTDVITLINKVQENNKTHFNNNDYKITVTINGTVKTDISDWIGTDAERTIYTCTNIEYNTSGRICKIEIETK